MYIRMSDSCNCVQQQTFGAHFTAHSSNKNVGLTKVLQRPEKIV